LIFLKKSLRGGRGFPPRSDWIGVVSTGSPEIGAGLVPTVGRIGDRRLVSIAVPARGDDREN
jgi:hypothetical protein